MSFWNEIKSKSQDAVHSALSNVGDHLASQLMSSPQLVKVGQNPGGNLSAAQLSSGMAPAAPAVSPTGTQPQQSFLQEYGLYIGLGFAGIVVIALIARK